jgi:hypothetical protein
MQLRGPWNIEGRGVVSSTGISGCIEMGVLPNKATPSSICPGFPAKAPLVGAPSPNVAVS